MAILTKYYKRGNTIKSETFTPGQMNSTGGNSPNTDNEKEFWSIRDSKNSNWGQTEIQKKEFDAITEWLKQNPGVRQFNRASTTDAQNILKSMNDFVSNFSGVQASAESGQISREQSEANIQQSLKDAQIDPNKPVPGLDGYVPPTQSTTTTPTATWTNAQGQTINPENYTMLRGADMEAWAKSQGYTKQEESQAPTTSQFSGTNFQKQMPELTPTTLKNTGIAQANPSVPANAGFINALYQEGFGRDATQAELDKFVGKTVKDASNIILGAERSPFFDTATGQPTDTPVDTTGDGTADISELTDDPDFKNLPPDLQAIAELMLNAVNARDEETRGLAQEALTINSTG